MQTDTDYRDQSEVIRMLEAAIEVRDRRIAELENDLALANQPLEDLA